MNGRIAGPLSPVSAGGSEWSGISKYQTLETDSPYPPNNRGQLVSPPVSTGSNGTMNGGGFPRGPGDTPSNGPSPPASIGRSSNGASLFNGTTLYSSSDAGRSRKDEPFETTLSEHYTAIKRYLTSSLRDEKGNLRPNKARDKLLRLSSVQFQELSTDVFDELQRRQSAARKPDSGLGGPPLFLLPKDSFHPKRNQARQKLSTLPSARFRDLATDVFYELERRFPRFAGGDINRTDSPSSMRGPPSRNGTPGPGGDMRPGSRGGPNGPGGPRIRRPSENSIMSNISGYPGPRSDSRGGSRSANGGMPQSPGLPPNDYGRPQPKTFQSNTIVPNKSTMVEDDETGGEDNDEEDAFGLESAARGRESKAAIKIGSSETEKKLIEEYQSQVLELREKLESVEETLRSKDKELTTALNGERNTAAAANAQKKEWADLQQKLETQLEDTRNLNDSLQSDLDRVRTDQANAERDFRAQIAELREAGSRSQVNDNPELEKENEDLRAELREQQQVTNEVRREAQEFLREMRVLSDRSDSSWKREDELANQVNQLEEEVKDWRNRYARTKTQLRSLRASSIGLTIHQDAVKYAKESGFTQEDGLVKDVHVTKFQISIDELLRVARAENPDKVVDHMKNVVVAVRTITQDIESSTLNSEMALQQLKLKTRVSATANNLITASKNFANAKGLSPLSLLDAAASHLTAAVVELVRTVKIRPTPAGELEDDDDGQLTPEDPTGFFPVQSTNQLEPQPAPFLGLRDRNSNISSVYSPLTSPRDSTATRPRSSSTKDGWGSRRPISRGSTLANGHGINGLNGLTGNKSLSPAPVGFGIRTQESDVEGLKIYLEDQTARLVQNIQSLVSCIRSESGITAITSELSAIAAVVGRVVTSTETAMAQTGNGPLRVAGDPIVKKLAGCRERLVEAEKQGKAIADMEDDGKAEMEWRMWTQRLPPIAFEIARETKELVQRVDSIDAGNNEVDDGSF